MRKTMSLKQLDANRRNAQKSTGPKTPQGLAVSKMNALKHGILSKEAVVHGRCIKEDDQEFAALHQRLWVELKPVGLLEEMLVDDIVTARWRMRRALKAESGEIALNVDEGQWTRYTQNPGPGWDAWHAHDDASFAMHQSVLGIKYLEKRLKEVREALSREGELSEATMRTLLTYFGGKPNMLTNRLEELRAYWLQNPDRLEASALRAKHQQMVGEFLDGESDFLAGQMVVCVEREENAEEARQAAAVLPSMEVVDKLMRYEAQLVRQRDRAMNQLERLQRRRLGEAVPPPLSLEVSGRP
jgi:predicted transcriptional regulator